MNNKCGLKENSHNWIGDTCTNCGIAWSVWAKRTIDELERQVGAVTSPDPDTPSKEFSRRTPEEIAIIEELYHPQGRIQAYATVTQPVVLHKWNGSHYPTTEANMTRVDVPAGTTLKIVMVSRFGDCGLTDDLNAENGYSLRVDLDSIMPQHPVYEHRLLQLTRIQSSK